MSHWNLNPRYKHNVNASIIICGANVPSPASLPAHRLQGQMNLVLNTLQVSSCIPVSAEEVISYILHKNPHRQLDQESDDEDSLADDFHNNKSRSSTVGNSPDAGEHRSVRSPPRAITGGGGSADDDENLPWRGGGGAVGGGDKALPTPKRSAERAAMRSLRVHRQYIIVDCRPKAEFEACRLAPALHLDPELLVSPDDLDAKLKEYIPLQVIWRRAWYLS